MKCDEDLTFNSDLVFENGIGKNLPFKEQHTPGLLEFSLDSFRCFKFFFVSFAEICTSNLTQKKFIGF